MGKIFYIMGKSASGKDTIYGKLRNETELGLQGVVLYTTRPMRANEENGKDYFFIDEDQIREAQQQGRIIEMRTYKTVHGPWRYLTMDDGQIRLDQQNYLMVGVLESYLSIRSYYGSDRVIPIYVEVEDGERLARALERERRQPEPKYAELCRRFLADSEDFSESRLAEAGIDRRYQNQNLEECLKEIRTAIRCFCETKDQE